MKTDRILGIIIYLMNHDNVSASYLAERFHVSVRTIQRDMISISAIGVPIYSESGKNGGYSILPTYKIKNGEIRSEEQQMIIKALESLATSYTNDTLKTLIEKYNAIIQKEGGQKVFWDFGVTKENTDVQSKNQLLEHAIDQKKMFLSAIPIVIMIMFSMGVGFILAALSVKYRDIVHLYSVFLTGFIYLAPIMYPLDILGNMLQTIVKINPVTNILVMFRGFMMYNSMPDLYTILMSIIPSVLILVLGVWVFYKKQDEFILYL